MRPCRILLAALALSMPALSLPAHAGPVRRPHPALAAPGLPDIPSLLRDVVAHQKVLDHVREDYTFRRTETMTTLDRKGKVRKVETKEHYDFFVNGHEIQKLIAKDGKPLSPADAQKEEQRAIRQAETYSRDPASEQGKETITISRLLEIVSFSNERRIQQDGRAQILFDFVGDPHAKTHGRNEEAVKRIYGTVAIDEAARQVAHLNATLDENLHLGFGLFATVEKGSNIIFNQALIRNEVWLPTGFEGHFDGKALLVVGLHVNVSLRYDDYRKFQATASEGPETAAVEPVALSPVAENIPPPRAK